jgi:hypothetical protein
MLPEPNFPVRPDHFIGRQSQIEAFQEALRQSFETQRTASFAVLGDWGIGKSSLVLKFASICASHPYALLPVTLPISKDLGDYHRLAESLLDKLTETLATSDSFSTRIRNEVQNWKLKRINFAGFSLDRETKNFLSSGSALLRHSLAEAWKRFLEPAHFRGAIFLLDDLHNLQNTADIALALRDQFQSFGIEGFNYSVCFSARSDYFSGIRSFAEPAVRFYNKLYLAPFTPDETLKYVEAFFSATYQKLSELRNWLFEKTLGHPFFLAFISRQLLARTQGSRLDDSTQYWPEIFHELEREKFSSDLAHLSEKENDLLLAVAACHDLEFSPVQFVDRSHYEYFSRLTERGLLIRTRRGRYKLYHPLFRAFLNRTQP